MLTCGHLFRDSDGKGEIRVDIFGPGEPTQVPGHFVGCDLEKDVGLVSIPARVPLQAIHVGAARLCDARQMRWQRSVAATAPRRRFKRATSIRSVASGARRIFKSPANRCRGVAAAEWSAPTDTRSAFATRPIRKTTKACMPRWLRFTKNSIGPSCRSSISRRRSASPEAALASAPLPSATHPSAMQSSSSEPAVSLAAAERDLPAMPAKMPAVNAPEGSTAAVASAVIGKLPAGLTTDEAATLAELRQKARAEVICIVRPLSDPHARSEIIVLDKASPEFLQKLADEHRSEMEASRRLTSLEVPVGSR